MCVCVCGEWTELGRGGAREWQNKRGREQEKERRREGDERQSASPAPQWASRRAPPPRTHQSILKLGTARGERVRTRLCDTMRCDVMCPAFDRSRFIKSRGLPSPLPSEERGMDELRAVQDNVRSEEAGGGREEPRRTAAEQEEQRSKQKKNKSKQAQNKARQNKAKQSKAWSHELTRKSPRERQQFDSLRPHLLHQALQAVCCLDPNLQIRVQQSTRSGQSTSHNVGRLSGLRVVLGGNVKVCKQDL